MSGLVEYPPKRHRLALSCIECRQRKVRCDRNNPCNRCVSSKRDCHYRTRPGAVTTEYSVKSCSPASSAGNHQDFADSSQTVIDGQSMNSEALYSRKGGTPIQSSTSTNFGYRQDQTPGFRVLNNQDLAVVWEQQGQGQLQSKEDTTSDTPSLKTLSQTPDATSGGKQVIPTNFHRAIIKGCYFGRSHWMTTGQELRRMKEFLFGQTTISERSTSIETLKGEISKLFQECKHVAKLRKSSRPSRSMAANELSASRPPPRDIADQLAHLYTSRFESVFRILHIPSFCKEYEHYWRNPESVPMISQFKILLVLAIGSSIYQADNEQEVRATAREHVYAAQAFLFHDIDKSFHNVECVQVQCLLVLARQALDVGGDLIWSLMGLVVHTAMQVGLHRDPEHFKKFSVLQCEIRRRLWSTVLEMTLQAALDSGMPFPLDMNDFDTKTPFNVNDYELNEQTQSLASHPLSQLTDTSIQILLLEYFPIRLEIVRLLNKPCINVNYDRVLTVSSIVNKACREARSLDCQNTTLDSAVFKCNFTEFLLRRFIPHLHQPFASLAREHTQFHFSRKARLDAALVLLAPKPDVDFGRLILGGGGMFKSRIKQCALTVGSELLAEAEEDWDNARSSPRSFRGMLTEVAKDALSEAVTRLRFGETSVKLHMTLSMVITRALSTSPPSSIQLELAQSAKESLEQSLSILKTFLGSRTTCDNEFPDPYQAPSQAAAFDDGLDFFDFLDSFGVETDLLTYV